MPAGIPLRLISILPETFPFQRVFTAVPVTLNISTRTWPTAFTCSARPCCDIPTAEGKRASGTATLPSELELKSTFISLELEDCGGSALEELCGGGFEPAVMRLGMLPET
jgi:hypothetical protein